MALIALPAVLTLAEASATLALLLDAIAADDAPVLDASGLQNLDSSAIAVLLQCRRGAQAKGKALTIVGAPPKLTQLTQLYGVEELVAAQPMVAMASA
jgi:phospholipid transport system transporter-binding protein